MSKKLLSPLQQSLIKSREKLSKVKADAQAKKAAEAAKKKAAEAKKKKAVQKSDSSD